MTNIEVSEEVMSRLEKMLTTRVMVEKLCHCKIWDSEVEIYIDDIRYYYKVPGVRYHCFTSYVHRGCGLPISGDRLPRDKKGQISYTPSKWAVENR